MLPGEMCEDLPIESDMPLLEKVDEPAVGEPFRFQGCRQLDIPQTSESRLLLPSITVRILASLEECLLGLSDVRLPTVEEPLCFPEDLFPSLRVERSAFDAWHRKGGG